MLVDSHCHLDMLKFEDHSSLDTYLEDAKLAGVQHVLSVCVTLERFPTMLEMVRDYPYISASVGVHRCLR